MKRPQRAIRSLAAALAAIASVAFWHADRAESQPADAVTLGRQALDAGRVDEAIAAFEKAVAAGPQNPAELAWLGSGS